MLGVVLFDYDEVLDNNRLSSTPLCNRFFRKKNVLITGTLEDFVFHSIHLLSTAKSRFKSSKSQNVELKTKIDKFSLKVYSALDDTKSLVN